MLYKQHITDLNYVGGFPGDPVHRYGSHILPWTGESQISECTTQFEWCQYLPLEKRLPMSTTLPGLPLLSNLSQTRFKWNWPMKKELICSVQLCGLQTNCLLLILKEFYIIAKPSYCLHCVFRSWLILSSACMPYHYLVQRQNALWIQMRMSSELRSLGKAPVLWCKKQSPEGNLNSQCGWFPPLEIPVGRQMNKNKQNFQYLHANYYS